MGRIAYVISTEPNTSDGESTMDVKVDLGGGDEALIPMYLPPGDDSRPVSGDYAILVDHPGDARYSCIGFIDAETPSETEDGERLIYSRDSSGARAGYIHLKRDATVTILDDSDTAVRFSELKAAFDELRDFVNDFINTKYNTHIHITTATIGTGAPGVIAPTTSVGTPSTASIDAAEIAEIKVP